MSCPYFSHFSLLRTLNALFTDVFFFFLFGTISVETPSQKNIFHGTKPLLFVSRHLKDQFCRSMSHPQSRTTTQISFFFHKNTSDYTDVGAALCLHCLCVWRSRHPSQLDRSPHKSSALLTQKGIHMKRIWMSRCWWSRLQGRRLTLPLRWRDTRQLQRAGWRRRPGDSRGLKFAED